MERCIGPSQVEVLSQLKDKQNIYHVRWGGTLCAWKGSDRSMTDMEAFTLKLVNDIGLNSAEYATFPEVYGIAYLEPKKQEGILFEWLSKREHWYTAEQVLGQKQFVLPARIDAMGRISATLDYLAEEHSFAASGLPALYLSDHKPANLMINFSSPDQIKEVKLIDLEGSSWQVMFGNYCRNNGLFYSQDFSPFGKGKLDSLYSQGSIEELSKFSFLNLALNFITNDANFYLGKMLEDLLNNEYTTQFAFQRNLMAQGITYAQVWELIGYIKELCFKPSENLVNSGFAEMHDRIVNIILANNIHENGTHHRSLSRLRQGYS